MKNNYYLELIEKYYEGETSPGEEQELRDYFASGDVAPELEAEKAMFSFYTEDSGISLGDDFDDKVMAEIEKEPNVKKLPGRKNNFWAYGAVASVLVLFGAFVIFNKKDRQLTREDLFNPEVTQTTLESDQELSREYARLALIEVSESLSQNREIVKGDMQHLGQLSQVFEMMSRLADVEKAEDKSHNQNSNGDVYGQ
jgi:hypothetical protein